MTERLPLAPLILVADDVPANVEVLHDQLAALGYRVVTAVDGPSAIEQCFAERPDLCILDIAMPAGYLGGDDRYTGMEVCRRIKRDPRTARIPVIFVTALSDTTDRVKAIEAGGDDFLTKPHNRQILGARVRSLIRLKNATDALEESYRKLRELERVRDDLMNMIVHDLKTPLTSILASLEMVLDGDFGGISAGARDAIADAESRGKELLTLIEDLLEIARIEEAVVELKLEPLAPAAFLEELVQEWSVRFEQERALVSLEVAADAPLIRADRRLLRRVFANLLQNALVHTTRGVAIGLSARRDLAAGVVFAVSDSGPGIPPEYQEVIFRKFERVQRADARGGRSSGLGLAFCKLAVEAHGGRIWVQSTVGRGSQFFVMLPERPPGLGGGQPERV
ncbi:MAG: ATP-binding protein [Gemmatimonadaceae bacterium]